MNWVGTTVVVIAFFLCLNVRGRMRDEAKYGFLEDEKWGNFKYNALTVGYFLIGLVIIQFVLGADSKSYGPGEVNLFPVNSESKNYRVDANMEEPINYMSLFVKSPLTVDDIQWPNGGRIFVSNCIVPNDGRSLCDIGDTRYYVEVEDYKPASRDTSDD